MTAECHTVMSKVPQGTIVVAMGEGGNFEPACRSLEEGLLHGSVKCIVIDCRQTASFGGSTLGLILKLSKCARRAGGRFAMCGLSPDGKLALRILNLHREWPICSSQAEALRAVERRGRSSPELPAVASRRPRRSG